MVDTEHIRCMQMQHAGKDMLYILAALGICNRYQDLLL